jgi:hypothetical protein
MLLRISGIYTGEMSSFFKIYSELASVSSRMPESKTVSYFALKYLVR